jgi:2-polyprenyl-6-methoxyphenol hydroxylase-like FAD-dependent oxidoreductase
VGRIVVLGGGVCGLATGILLSRDGNDVEVWERDATPPPASIDEAWEDWDRRGVKQFRQPHSLQARVKHMLERELPDVADKLVAAGAARVDPHDRLPAAIEDRAARPDDERLVAITARRPTFEQIVAEVAQDEPRLRIRRGVEAVALTSRAYDGLAHVTGVRTRAGEEQFDLVVDAMGRSSPLPSWLAEIGAPPMLEEAEDSGFAYYTRFFRSRAGAVPSIRTVGLLNPIGSFSILTLPGDRDTWSVTLYAAAGDAPLKAFRHPDRWDAVVRRCPLHAHWLDGDPISAMTIMAGVLDRRRRLTNDGRPVATGVVLVADSWACTNPSLARGLALGLDHAARLRDVVRDHLDVPRDLAASWDEVTEREFTPWYAATIAQDRARLAEIRAFQKGTPPPPPDEAIAIRSRLPLAATRDATAFRALMEIIGCLTLPPVVFGRAEVVEAIQSTTHDGESPPLAGPSRAELLALLA